MAPGHLPSHQAPADAPGNPARAPWANRRLLLFDLDDTLCDYASARSVRLSQAFRLAFDAARIPEPARPPLDDLIAESLAYHPHGADHFVDLLARYGVAAQHAQRSIEWYRGNPLHGLSLFQGVRELLTMVRELPSGGRRTLGVITNGPTQLQREKLRVLGIEQLIDFAIISEEFGVAKPDPAIFREALHRGNATPETAVFVGDAPEFDILGAHRVGIPAIWMNARHLAWPQTLPPPDREIHSLDEIVPLLGHRLTSAAGGLPSRTSFPS